MATGTVKFINTAKGFGFITQDAGDDIFVHVNNIQTGIRPLQEGQKVEFTVQRGPKGLAAVDVRPI